MLPFLLFLLLFTVQSSSTVSDVLCDGKTKNLDKHVVCYYEGVSEIHQINVCQCTHIIFTNHVHIDNNFNVKVDRDVEQNLSILKKRNENLLALFTLRSNPKQTTAILKTSEKRSNLTQEISDLLHKSLFDGVEIDLEFDSKDKIGKTQVSLFVKDLKVKLSHHRVKRGNKKHQDHLVTDKKVILKEKVEISKKSRRPRDSGENVAIRSRARKAPKEEGEIMVQEQERGQLFLRLPVHPEHIAKKFDLKGLSKYVDIMVVPTHNMVDETEKLLTYHPSRLMGLSDMLNTDSILDLLTGLGAPKSKLIITLPTNVLKFQLTDQNKNTPRSPVTQDPSVIGQTQLCHILYNGNFTIERDEDLTAPYAFSNKTWLAFEDKISANIKGKYVLLRDLAGASVYPIDSEDNTGICSNNTGTGGVVTSTLFETFSQLARKPRQVVLQSLQEEIHGTEFYNFEGGVKLSEYRIVRVVDHSGAVQVIRKNTKTQFECSRQGYFSHPLGCNKFYRCVKFNQYSDDYTVFEYDCPSGLAFDERWEVCVWPGSLPHGAPCTGSSEIAPVPRAHYACPNIEGYFADPENCRWFFACLDHARDGISPLTAYEFRCPFGLVFDEAKLACDWPWLVGGCGARGGLGYVEENYGRHHSELHTASVTNQQPGIGYIASTYDDHQDKASFATIPDYQVSGGRTLFSGGVVLEHGVGLKAPAGVVVPETPKAVVTEDDAFVGNFERVLYQTPLQAPRPFSVGTPVSVAVSDGLANGYDYLKPVKPPLTGKEYLPPSPVAVVTKVPKIPVQITPSEPVFYQHTVSTPKSLLLQEKPLRPVVSYTPRPVVYEEPVVYGERIQLEPPKPVVYQQSISLSTPKTFVYEKRPVSVVQPAVYEQHVTRKPVAVVQPVVYEHRVTPKPVPVVQPVVYEQHVTPKPVSVVQPVVYEQRITPVVQPVVYEQRATPKPVSVVQPVVYEQRITPVVQPVVYEQRAPPKPVSVVQPVVYEQRVTPVVQPVVYEQPIAVSKPVLYEQQISVTPSPVPVVRPVVYKQRVTPKPLQVVHPVVFEQEIQVQTPKSVVYDQPIAIQTPKPVQVVQPVVYQPKPAVYKQQFTVTPKPVFYEQVRPKPVEVVQPVVYKQRVSLPSPKPVVYEQPLVVTQKSVEVAQPVVYEQQISVTPKPVLYHQTVEVTPRPVVQQVVYQQKFEVPSPKPVVYQQISVTPGPVVYEQRIQVPSPKSVVYEQPISVTPKPIFYEQKQVPVVYQHRVSTPKPVVYHQPISIAPPPEPVIYEPRAPVVTQKPVVYEHNIAVQTPKPIVYQQPVVYEQKFEIQAPKSVVYQQPLVTPKPVVYAQPISVTPKPVVYEQNIEIQTPKPVVYQPSVAFAPKPVVYQQNIQIQTPKPVVYEQRIKVQTSKPVFYEQSVAVTPKSVVYEEPITVSTPKPVVYEQLVKIQTPKPVFYEQSVRVTPKPVVYQEPLTFSTPKPVVYQEPLTISTPKPVVYEQRLVVTPPPQVIYEEKYQVSPKARPFAVPQPAVLEPEPPVVYSGHRPQPTPLVVPKYQEFNTYVTPKPVSIGQPLIYEPKVEVSTPKTIISTPKATFYEHEYIQNVEVNGKHQVPAVQPFLQHIQPPKIVQQVDIEPEVHDVNIAVQTPNYGQRLSFENKVPFPNVFVQEKPRIQVVEVQTPKPFLKSQVVYEEEYIQQPKLEVSTQRGLFYETRTKIPTYIEPKVEVQQELDQYVPARLEPKTPFVNEYLPPQVEYQTVAKARPVFYARKNPVKTALNAEIVTEVTQRPIVVQDLPKVQKGEFFVGQFEAKKSDDEYQEVLPRTPEYVFNTNIKIGPPPETYVDLSQVRTSTEAYVPEITSEREIYTIRPRGRARPTTSPGYLPPTTEGYVEARKRPKSKTTVISIGEVDKDEVDEENVEELLNKYGGKYGELLEDDKDKFVTKIVKGEGRGKIKVGKEPEVSTVGYEVTSTRTRQRTGRRKKIGTSTSTTTTETYEDYDDVTTTDVPQDTADVSLASLDLKNLKLKKDKKTVIVVSQVSDSNPLLIGKLAGQCSCQSNEVSLRRKSNRQRTDNEDEAPRSRDGVRGRSRGRKPVQTTEDTPVVKIGGQDNYPYNIPVESTTLRLRGRRPNKLDYDRDNSGQDYARRRNPSNIKILTDTDPDNQGLNLEGFITSTTLKPIIPLPLAEIQDQEPVIRTKVGPNDVPLFAPIPAAEIASSLDYPDRAGYVQNDRRSKTGRKLIGDVGPNDVPLFAPVPAAEIASTLDYPDRAGYARNDRRQKAGRKLIGDIRPNEVPLFEPIPAAEIASTVDYQSVPKRAGYAPDDRRQKNGRKQIGDGVSQVKAGAAFDRYGPGGWRSADETLQGSVDCQRPGLFRHPKYCNKFYSCNYDPWKKRYTLHVFNCPVHLAYDSNLGACNWPSKGPACVDDNILV